MSLILIAALVATPSAEARPLLPTEKVVISNAIASFLPNRPQIATDPVKSDAVVVCGRANGRTFKVAIYRNAAGHIVRADQAYVTSPADNTTLRYGIMSMCIDNGYTTL
jgi:hypothetical protein